MGDLGEQLRAIAKQQLELVLQNREAYLRAWVAEHGCLPSECYIEEKRHEDGSITIRVVKGKP